MTDKQTGKFKIKQIMYNLMNILAKDRLVSGLLRFIYIFISDYINTMICVVLIFL